MTAWPIRCSARRDPYLRIIAIPRLPPHLQIRRWAALIAASGLLAVGLSVAGFPAALLLGPMLAAIAFGASGARLAMPRPAFLGAQAIIGCLVAHAVTADTARMLAADGALMLLVVLLTVAAGAIVGVVLTRLHVLPGTTAAWGSSPGGAAAMVAMAEDYGADPRLVAFMQYVRVVAVVLSASLVTRALAAAQPMPTVDVPGSEVASVLTTIAVAVVGAAVALRLKIPAGAQIGPMVLGSVLHATGLARIDLPAPLLEAAYAVIGWYVGLRFTRETVIETLHALPGILAATLGVIALCGVWALGLTHLLPIDFLTAFLATSPGGLDSVAIIAVGSSADVSFVLAVQTLRLFVVLVTGPILARWIARATPDAR